MPGLIDAPPTPTAAPAYTTKDATAATATSRGYTPTDYSATGYDAAPFTSKDYVITPQGTVQQQVLDIVKNDSPLIQQASNQALIDMNARGLVNSSLAVGAARDAVYKTALPIATTDANAYNQAMFKSGDAANLALTNTANAKNQALQFNTAATNLALTNTGNAKNAASNFEAAAGNQASLANAQLQTNTSLANSAASNDAGKLAYGTQAQYNLAGLDAETRARLANLNAQTQMETANLDANTRMSLGQLQANTQMQTAQLDANTRMNVANLDAATRTNIANLDSQTRVLMANLDANTKTNLANIDGQYRNLLQTNQSASAAFNQVATNLSNISTSNLSEDAKNAATATQMNILNELLRQQAQVAGTNPSDIGSLNIGSYFNWDPATSGGASGGTTGGTSGGTTGGSTQAPPPPPGGTPYWIGANGAMFNSEQAAQESLTGYSLPGYQTGQLQPAGYFGAPATISIGSGPAPADYDRESMGSPAKWLTSGIFHVWGVGFVNPNTGASYPTEAEALRSI